MLKIAPCNNSLVTSAMFRIFRKCAKHGKWGFGMFPTYFFANSLRLHTVQNWITQHPNPKSAMQHLLWRITGRISLRLIISHWAHEVDPLCKIYLKHQEITLRIERNKGHADMMVIKCRKYPRRQAILEIYSSFSATD